jgi:hypothetical protein
MQSPLYQQAAAASHGLRHTKVNPRSTDGMIVIYDLVADDRKMRDLVVFILCTRQLLGVV